MRFTEFFQDEKGALSAARLINIAVCAAAIAITLLLTYNDKMSEGYFMALLAYGAGVQSYSKFIESKKPTQGDQ